VGGRRELRRVGQSTESGAAAASPPAGWGGRRGRGPGQTLPRGTGSELVDGSGECVLAVLRTVGVGAGAPGWRTAGQAGQAPARHSMGWSSRPPLWCANVVVWGESCRRGTAESADLQGCCSTAGRTDLRVRFRKSSATRLHYRRTLQHSAVLG